MSPDGILLEANQAALDFAGVVNEEVVGKPFWETVWWAASQEEQKRLQDLKRTIVDHRRRELDTNYDPSLFDTFGIDQPGLPGGGFWRLGLAARE